MSCAQMNMGGRVYISTTAVDGWMSPSDFAGLTYEQVPGVGNIGDTGLQQNISSYGMWARPVGCKGKGQATATDFDIEFADRSSSGMDLLKIYGSALNNSEYAVKIEWGNGSAEYHRVLVVGPAIPHGENEDFKRVVYTFAPQQPPVSASGTVSQIMELFEGGQAGFFTSADPKYRRAYTTHNGNTLAVSPGDPVGRVESLAGGLTLSQPSSPLRPVLGRYPEGGVRNILANSDNVSGAAWINTETNSGGKYQVFDVASSAQHTIRQNIAVPDNTTVTFSVDVETGTLPFAQVAIATKSGGFPRASINLNTGIIESEYGSPIATDVAEVQPGRYRVRVTANMGSGASTPAIIIYLATSDTSNASYIGSGTDYIFVRRPQIEIGSDQTPYQNVIAPYDITEPGKRDIWSIYGNGTQWMTFGTDQFGSATLFAGAGQEWVAAQQFISTLSGGVIRHITKSASNQFEGSITVLAGTTTSPSGVRSSLRGSTGTSAVLLGEAFSPHVSMLAWDGVDGIEGMDQEAMVNVPVGVNPDDVRPIIVGAINDSSPSNIFTGFFMPFLLDAAPSNPDMVTLRNALMEEAGV